MTCSSDLTIKLWDTANDYTNTKTLHGHDHSVSSVRFTPDGDLLLSASRDKTIRIWEFASGWVRLHHLEVLYWIDEIGIACGHFLDMRSGCGKWYLQRMDGYWSAAQTIKCVL